MWKPAFAIVVIATTTAISAAGAVAAEAGTPLTNARYLARLRAATTKATKAQAVAFESLQNKGTTTAQVKANFEAWGKTESAFGRSLVGLTPPRAAQKGNMHLAAAEQTL